MNAKAERPIPVKRAFNAEKVVDFSPEQLAAPFLLRCGALIIDYILIIAVPVVCMLISRYTGNDGAKLLNSELNNTGWLIAILFALTNLIILPLFSGQSLGKMLTGLRIVTVEGRSVSFGTILVRHTFGYLFTVLTAGLGFLLSVVNKRGRALHDYIAGTVVVYGNRRILK
jgi:uncharacterized RDD family membrane protein YckC